MKVTQICIGRFHHFHLARQLEKCQLLDSIITGYPRSKIKQEKGIPSNKIKCFPWIHAPLMLNNRFGFLNNPYISDWLRFQDYKIIDNFASKEIRDPGILIALSSCGLKSGKKIQKLGGIYLCDRGSSHIQFQNELLIEEHKRWGIEYKGNSIEIMEREENEYHSSNFITVPSKFVHDSFISKGVPAQKLIKIPYGANLERFKKLNNPPKNEFNVLWVGQISLRKGFLYALEAFAKLSHPNKNFTVIGNIDPKIESLIQKIGTNKVSFIGNVQNKDLSAYYSSHHVFVLSSIEEGLAMVQGEALACGCPIIVTPNTGAEDLIENSKEGFIVPIRNSTSILEKFQELIENPYLREEMSENALRKVKNLGGWDQYGENFKNTLQNLNLASV